MHTEKSMKSEEKSKKELPSIITDRRQCVKFENIMQVFERKDKNKMLLLQEFNAFFAFLFVKIFKYPLFF
jgi:hypothetical protein